MCMGIGRTAGHDVRSVHDMLDMVEDSQTLVADRTMIAMLRASGSASAAHGQRKTDAQPAKYLLPQPLPPPR